MENSQNIASLNKDDTLSEGNANVGCVKGDGCEGGDIVNDDDKSESGTKQSFSKMKTIEETTNKKAKKSVFGTEPVNLEDVGGNDLDQMDKDQ